MFYRNPRAVYFVGQMHPLHQPRSISLSLAQCVRRMIQDIYKTHDISLRVCVTRSFYPYET